MVLERLKQETNAEHRRLERALDLLRPDLTLAQYQALLGRWWGFLPVWEQAAAELADANTRAMILERQKAPLLERDLRFFRSDINAIARCRTLPFLRNEADVLGSMYVLEGSTLGGQLLSRHFSRQLGVTPEAGGAFFSNYGADSGKMWKAFRTHMIETAQPEKQDRIVEAAGRTFAFLEQWLCPTKL